MDRTTISQLSQILRELRKTTYSIRMPEFKLFDIDSTLLDAYGKQECAAFNHHYQSNGSHPLLAYDRLTGDLMKAELRDGAKYYSRNADIFMKSLLAEFTGDFLDIPLCLWGDSGFAPPDLYEVPEEKNCKYAIRLQKNKTLIKLAEDTDAALYRATMYNQIDYAVEYSEFLYQTGSWNYPRRVAFKTEKSYGQIVHMYTFIITTMENLKPY